jgi:hypothetical protein
MEQKIIREVTIGRSKRFEYISGAPKLNTKAFEELRTSKTKDLEKGFDYIMVTDRYFSQMARGFNLIKEFKRGTKGVRIYKTS